MKKNEKGLYRTQVTINGKRKVFSAKTQVELKRKIAAYTETAEKGMLFKDVVDKWLSEELPAYRPGTQKTYQPAAERARTHFGEYRITDITPGMINAYVHTLGRSFASGTVSNSLSVVSIIFRWAIFNNLAKTNPTDQVDVPTGLRKSKRPAATPEQVEIIKANATDFGLVANLLLYTGLRLGEACALTYADIDRNAKTISVTKQVIWEGNRPQLQTTKTANGIRTIVIPDQLFAILPQGKPYTYIVGNDTEPITRNAFHCRWLHWCKDMDMVHDKPVTRDGKPTTIHEADVTPHQLRHNYATILWEAGVPPEVAQKLMGHSDIHTTQQLYLEIRGDHLEAAAEALNKHLSGAKQK